MKLLKQNIQIPEGQWDSHLLVLPLLGNFGSSVCSHSNLCRMWWSSFSHARTPPASSGLAAVGVLPRWPDCCYYQRGGLIGTGSTPPLHHFYAAVTQTENLCSLSHTSFSTSHSAPVCSQLNLLFNWRFSPGVFSHFPCFSGREYAKSTACNNLPHPCPIHPCYENPDQPL